MTTRGAACGSPLLGMWCAFQEGPIGDCPVIGRKIKIGAGPLLRIGMPGRHESCQSAVDQKLPFAVPKLFLNCRRCASRYKRLMAWLKPSRDIWLMVASLSIACALLRHFDGSVLAYMTFYALLVLFGIGITISLFLKGGCMANPMAAYLLPRLHHCSCSSSIFPVAGALHVFW